MACHLRLVRHHCSKMKRKSDVLAAVQKNGLQLADAPDDLKADKAVVMLAVSKSGEALQYAAKKLTGDKDVVLAAVRQRGTALQFAAKKLRADREVVTAAVSNSSMACFSEEPLAFASRELQRDKELVLTAACKCRATPLNMHQLISRLIETWLKQLWRRVAVR